MRHWYLLARECVRASPTCCGRRAEPTGFCAGGVPSGFGLSAADRRRMLILGAVESVPLGAAGAAGMWQDCGVPIALWIILGVAATGAMCWLLRGHTPATVIHVAPTDDSLEGR